MARYIIRGDDLIIKLCKALELKPNRTRRIVIDAEVNKPLMVYVELYGTERLVDYDFDKLVSKAIVSGVD